MLKYIGRIVKLLGVGLLVFSVLILIAMMLLQYVLYKQVSDRLKHSIEGNGNVIVQCGSLNFNVFKRSISLTKVIAYDSVGFYYLRCDTIQLKGINPFPLLTRKQLNLAEVVLSGGKIDINIDKKQPVLNNNKYSWLAENFTVKHFRVTIVDKKKSAGFFIDSANATRFNSSGQQIAPLHTAEANIADIVLGREENIFLIDSLQIRVSNGFSTLQANSVDLLSLSRFAGEWDDTVSFPLKKLLIEKLQAGIPLYYFKYLSSKKIPRADIPFLRIDGLSAHIMFTEGDDEIKKAFTLKSIPINLMFRQLIIQKGKIVVYQDSYRRLEFDLQQLKAHNLRTESTFKFYPFFADALSLSLSNFKYSFNDQIHHIKVYTLNYNTNLNILWAGGIRIGSDLDYDEYFNRKKFQTDMPSLTIHAAKFQGLNVSELLNKNKFAFRKIWADTLRLKMIRDKNYPYDLTHFPPMIQDQIFQLPFIFSTDTASVQNGEITYYEIPRGATLEDAGMFQFKSAVLHVYRCTNDTVLLKSNDTLLIHFRGNLYGQGLLDVFVDIPLLSKNYWHRVYGTIGKFNAREFNRITVPAAAVKINRGKINGGEFYFEANNEFSSGYAELLFEKLKVTVLTQTGSAARSQADFLKSIIANVFMVHDNPEPGKEVMVGKIYVERDINRWMINFWWKSLLQGVRSIVFAKEVQLRDMAASFNEYKKLRKQREQMYQQRQK